jgi:hypothetical protein
MRVRALGIITSLGLVAALSVVGTASAEHRGGAGHHLTATLKGLSEVPGPGDPDGTGTASIQLQPGAQRVCFTLQVSGIILPAIAAHIHVGATGVAGPVIVTLAPPGSTGTSSGCVNTPQSTVLAILSNPAGYYVNVHTTDFPNGALRGQLATSSGQGQGSVTLQTSLKGKNEVPGPGDPDGSGSATITLDRTHNQVCFTIHVSGITLPATGAHIHQGAQGVAGPIVVTLSPPDTTGSSSGCVVVTPDLLNAILANVSGYYVNVHTVDFPNGALRGQLSGHGNGGGNDGDDEHHGDGDDHHGGGDHHHGGGHHHHHGGGDAHGVRVGA